MSKLKRSTLIFIFLLLFGLGSFVVQKAQASKTLAEQLADLKAEALNLQKQLLQTQGYVFTKNLKLGDKNKDVRQLQKILNLDSQTQISSAGLGSLGQETDFFGNLTLSAVIRFQEKYATEVLRPANLFSGTGYVGVLTRNKLNSLNKETFSVGNKPEDETLTAQNDRDILDFGLGGNVFSESDELIVTFVSNYSGLPSSSLTVYGSGFTKENNIVHFSDEYQVSGIKSSGSSLTFSVPKISSGRYKLFVSNSKNEVSKNKTFFIVTSPSTKPPEIISITPAEGQYGEEITIHGSGFTSVDNEIRTSYGIISGLDSSDGKTLKLKVEPYPETPNLQALSNKELGFSWSINFYVINDNGVNKTSKIFTLNL